MRALIVLLVPAAAVAAPSTKLAMRYFAASNTHIGNNAGAIGRYDESSVTVELRDGGKVAASVAGTRKLHNLYVNKDSSYNTDDVTKWKTTWTGTFKKTAASLELALVLDADTCSHTKTYDDASPETLACRPAAKRTTLTCTTTQIAFEASNGAKPRNVDAWSCAPAAADDLGESPTWLLGKTECIESGNGLSFHPCRP
jgi:hypothetical protein